LVGVCIILLLTAEWFLFLDPIGNRPLLLFGIMPTLLSAQIVIFDMLAEMFLFRSRPRSVASLVGEATAAMPKARQSR
jgi:hypothetical protein